MRYLVLLLLLFGLEGKAQSYTFTLNECRVEATTGELRESFLVDRIRYFDRGDQTFIFDHESVLSVFDANITNYGRDSLKALIDIWIDSCNVVPIPTPPAPTALFANTTSLELDGSTEYVTVANPADSSLSFNGNAVDAPYSLSAWIYCVDATQFRIFSKATSGIEYFWGTDGSDKLVLFMYDSGGTSRIFSTGSAIVPENKWVFVTATYDGSETKEGITTYINGIASTMNVGSVGTYLGMTTTTSPLNIGELNTGTPSYAEGKIDQPTVFNKELSVSEIKELMALRDYSYFSDTASIVSSWYMDAPDDLGVANGVTDRFGSNDGTGVNTTTADNLVPCITFPYDYSLETSALYTNLTPFQDDSASAEMGFAWDFNGVDESIIVNAPINSAMHFGDGINDTPLSFCAWIEPTDATDFYITSTRLSANVKEYEFFIDFADRLTIELYDTNPVNFLRLRGTNPTITQYEGQKIFVCATYSALTQTEADLKLYVNGKEITSTSSTGGTYVAMDVTSSPLRIFAGSKLSEGKGFENIAFDKELSQAEITTLYNSHGLIDPRDTDLSANIVGYWNGYNSTNTAGGVLDLSGNGNNGTPVNMDLADFQYDSPRSIFEADSSASFSYDGVADYVEVPDTDSLTFLNQAGTADTTYTISWWMQNDDANYINKLIFSKRNTPTSTNFEYLIGGGAGGALLILQYGSGNASNSLTRTSGTTIVGFLTANGFGINDWIHCAITYDATATNTGFKGYINGIEYFNSGSDAGTYTSVGNTGVDLWVMRDYAGGYDALKLSNVTMMKGIELDLCQVQEIYNDGSPQNPTDWTFYQPNFIHWRMNSGDDPATSGGVLDIIGNINASGVNAPTLDETSYPTN